MAWHRHGYTAVVTSFGWNTFFLGGSQQADAVAGLLVLVINARKLGLTQQRAEENVVAFPLLRSAQAQINLQYYTGGIRWTCTMFEDMPGTIVIFASEPQAAAKH